MDSGHIVYKNAPVSDSDRELDNRMVLLVQNAIERAKIKGAPVALFDKEQNRPYLLYPNGEKRYS